MELTALLINKEFIRQEMLAPIKIDITRDKLINLISNIVGVEPYTLSMKTRKREIAEARQLYCYFARKMTNYSLPTIGEPINRHHTTVLFSIDNIRNLKEVDKRIRNYVNLIEEKL